MSIDMSRFHATFFEEAQEHLGSMEALLLEIDLSAPDAEALNAIFRAAHSIKGSAGTFGFNDLAEVTHDLETLLDLVRKGERALTEDIVDASLVAGDVLKNLLAAHQGQGEADHDAAEQIRARLVMLAAAQGAAAATEGGEAPGALLAYRLHAHLSGSDAARLAENLRQELLAVGSVDEFVLDAEGTLSVLVQGTSSAEELAGILDYVADSGSVSVSAVATSAVEAAPAPVEAAGDDDPDGAFGFFAPLAEDASVDGEAAAAAAPATSQGFEADDGSFGLFDMSSLPAQEAPSAAPAAETVVARAGSESPQAATARTEQKGAPAAAKAAADSSIRVSVEKVDQMINLVGELVITQAMLAQAAADVDPQLHERLLSGIGQLARNTRDLQESVMSVRMLPISTVFSRFPRLVRDLSQKLGKKVQLIMTGEHTELDKTLIERITDPLTHLVRNSLDHGIESPQARAAAQKTEMGTLMLRAYHQSGNIVIEVSDDGGGLHRERILAKARERGLPVHDNMSDQDVWMLIFEPGFSTAAAVTDVSGRGVGMDVVKRNIAAMNGRVELDSVAGVGTRVTVRLPLTLAILDGMSVAVGNETYIIPLDYVVESLQATPAMIKSVSGRECLIQVRGEYLPVIGLREQFRVPGDGPALSEGIMVVLESDGTKAALFVDALIGQHQVVIKSLEANYHRVLGVAGATIMGDGRVALIVDAAAMVGLVRRSLPVAA
ncbi:chemotaxis protein CheW [Uliginosibacterium sp. H1]|uniref:chemotaxis protein CheW n=1 Tax=Uliginosibacterium sp. H1 TaxID=3114757 RepID=UPI002E18583B|nr:chemotaxis protein CheW [Uliginosibacterium sp. H1]